MGGRRRGWFVCPSRGAGWLVRSGEAGAVSPGSQPHTPLIPAKAGIHGACLLAPSGDRDGCLRPSLRSFQRRLGSSYGNRPGRRWKWTGAATRPALHPASGLRRIQQLDSSLQLEGAEDKADGGVNQHSARACRKALWIPAFAGMSGGWGWFASRSRELTSFAAARARPDRAADGRPLAEGYGEAEEGRNKPRTPLCAAWRYGTNQPATAGRLSKARESALAVFRPALRLKKPGRARAAVSASELA